MRMTARRERASIKTGALLALAALVAGAAIYQWKLAPPERALRLSLARFEVTRDHDAERTPPTLEALAATIALANEGDATEFLPKLRLVASSEADLSEPRSWSTIIHRDSMLRDLRIPPGESIRHTFVMPWTEREETLYFADGSKVYLGFSITMQTPEGESITITEPFGHVVPRKGRIEHSEHRLLTLELSRD